MGRAVSDYSLRRAELPLRFHPADPKPRPTSPIHTTRKVLALLVLSSRTFTADNCCVCDHCNFLQANKFVPDGRPCSELACHETKHRSTCCDIAESAVSQPFRVRTLMFNPQLCRASSQPTSSTRDWWAKSWFTPKPKQKVPKKEEVIPWWKIPIITTPEEVGKPTQQVPEEEETAGGLSWWAIPATCVEETPEEAVIVPPEDVVLTKKN